MIRLDQNLLDELGLGNLPDEHRRLVLRAIYSELELRVGSTLVRVMTKEQLNEFEALAAVKDDQLALAWLDANRPDYKSVVKDEFAKLRGEILDARGSIAALSACYAAG